MGFLNRFKGFKERIRITQGNMDSFSTKTNLDCPKCGAKLFQLFSSKGGYPQIYVCRKCNYQGSIGLEKERKSKSSKSSIVRKMLGS